MKNSDLLKEIPYSLLRKQQRIINFKKHKESKKHEKAEFYYKLE